MCENVGRGTGEYSQNILWKTYDKDYKCMAIIAMRWLKIKEQSNYNKFVPLVGS